MNRHRLLIVEDEVIVALDIEDRLAALGYQLVGHALTGEGALELTRELRPDLVLMDIRLQGDMDGITAAAEIRRRFHVPVIFLTAYSEDETLERAKLAEPYGYILKPFDDRELKSAVEIALYKHRTEEEIRHLNRLYDVLSQINQTVVRVHSREELLPEVCRVLVERGQVDLAWISWLDPDTARIEPVAGSGSHTDLLAPGGFSAAASPQGQGNPGKAVRDGVASVCNCCAASDCLYPEAQSPESVGFQSCGSFPLHFKGRVCAVLNVCVAEQNFFGDREMALLQEVAADVSFALEKIAAEAQKDASEQALRESEARSRLMFDLASVGMAQADPRTGRFQRVNPKMCEITGYTADELLGGMSFSDITHPEDRLGDWEAFQQVVGGKAAAYRKEKRYFKKDGALVWINVNATTYRDSSGQPVYSLGVIEDITTRKKAEMALQESQERFRAFMDHSPAVAWAKDEAGRYVYLSKAYEDRFKVRLENWQGKTDFDLWPPEVAEKFRQNDLAALAAGRAVENTEEAVNSKGEVSSWWNVKFPFEDAARQKYIGGIAVDITPRLKAEADLKQSELRFRQMAEAVQEVFWLAPPDFQSILYVSPAFEKIWGIPCAELYANPLLWLQAVLPEDVPSVQRALKELNQGQAYDIEYRITRPDGSIRWVNDRGYALRDGSGHIILTSGVASDITSRQETEFALRASEEKFRLTMEAIEEGVWEWDLPAGELHISPGFLRIFGYDPDTASHSYDHWMTAIHPEDFPSYRETLQDHLEGRRPAFEAEFRARTEDGRYLWFSSRGRVVSRGADGTPLRMVGTLRDITEKRLAQTALEESLSLHKATIESTADGIMVVDLDQQIVSWNRKFMEMWQIPLDLMEARDNKKTRSYAAGLLQDPEAFLSRSDEVFANLTDETFDLLNFKDGRIFERYSIPQLMNSRTVGRVLSFRDVTARVRAEAALKKSESNYRRLVETANEGIWTVDPKIRTIYVNQLMADMMGYSQDEMQGRPVTDFMFPEDLADYQEKVSRRHRGKYEQRLRRRDGSELWTIVSVRALKGEAGEFQGSFAMLTDITERKRAEEGLKKSEKRVRAKLESILAPSGDIGHLDLEDIIDTGAIQSLMDDFYQLTHILMALIDLQGKVLVGVGWQDICTKFHRVHPETYRRCLESDTILSQGVPPGTFKLYKCSNNMWSMATPVMVGGKHVGNLFLGQFLFEDEAPDYDFFGAQAREFGFDEEAYLAALAKVPRLSRETLDTAMSFFTKLAHMISLLSLSNIRLARSVTEQERLLESLRLSEEHSRSSEAFLSDIFASIKDGLTILDLDRNILRVNPAVEQLISTKDLVGQKCYAAFHQRDHACPHCPVEHTLKTGEDNLVIRKSKAGGENGSVIELYSYPLINRNTGKLEGVIEYVRDVTERQRAAEALAEKHRELEETAQELEQSRNMLQFILESIPVRVFWKDRNLRYLGCNTQFARDAGFHEPQELLGRDDFAMGWREHADLYRADDLEVMESRRAKVNIIEPLTNPEGKTWLKTSKVPLSGPDGEIFGVLGVYEDITELKAKEDQLRASLQEKEVMLKEIHHRVKNNMQMISTLFDLQLRYAGDQDPPTLFRDCQNRIRSMALIHESLYHTDTLSSINFRQYLQKLVNRLLTSFGSSVQGIKATVTGAELHLGINQAVPAGLVASELIMNCLKHAFPGQRAGSIEITVGMNNGHRQVEIRDDGIGLGRDFSPENFNSFGWLMISNLMKQLEGTINVVSEGGTTCRMIF